MLGSGDNRWFCTNSAGRMPSRILRHSFVSSVRSELLAEGIGVSHSGENRFDVFMPLCGIAGEGCFFEGELLEEKSTGGFQVCRGFGENRRGF